MNSRFSTKSFLLPDLSLLKNNFAGLKFIWNLMKPKNLFYGKEDHRTKKT